MRWERENSIASRGGVRGFVGRGGAGLGWSEREDGGKKGAGLTR
jgi:hypothetical protein